MKATVYEIYYVPSNVKTFLINFTFEGSLNVHVETRANRWFSTYHFSRTSHCFGDEFPRGRNERLIYKFPHTCHIDLDAVLCSAEDDSYIIDL